MDSALVIKVKYGDTLRRFTAYVDENGLLDLDMAGLKMKIHSLYKFAPDADLTLTYIDEDKDEITLVDDNDLCDATRQNLNPLRITVVLNSIRARRSESKLNKSFAPIDEHLLSQTEVLKSSQEPILDIFSKRPLDLPKKVASVILAKLEEFSLKSKLSNLSSVSECQDGARLSGEKSTSGCSLCPKVTEDAELPKLNAVDSIPTDFEKVLETGYTTKPKGNSIPPSAALVELDVDLLRVSTTSACSNLNISDRVSASDVIPHNNEKAQKENLVNLAEKSIASGRFESTKDLPHLFNLHPFQASQTPLPHNRGSCSLNGGNIKKHPGVIEQSFVSQAKLNLVENFPNLGFMPGVKSPNSRFRGLEGRDALPSSGTGSFNKNYSYSDSSSRIFHRGIQCDGCGVLPIMGPRFKSKVKEDYDLCRICFSDLGNEAEYTRLDYPVPVYLPWSSKDFKSIPRFLTPSFRDASQGCGRKMFDSRIVYNLNVVDTTVIAPNVLFTKKWRMCNNGAIAWPHGLQLVWIGGDQLTDRVSIELETPVDGVPVDKELVIVVDFKSPERPGQYISNWNMALPSGEIFGQRICVLIQVDASLLGSADSFKGINLNEPPHNCMVEGKDINHGDAESVYGILQETSQYEGAVEVASPKPAVDRLDILVNDDSVVSDDVSVPFTPNVSTAVHNPGIYSSSVPSQPSLGPVMSPAIVDYNNAFERTLLDKLERMGFKRTALNTEVLKMNAYDL